VQVVVGVIISESRVESIVILELAISMCVGWN
jgi:hypothetical protein